MVMRRTGVPRWTVPAAFALGVVLGSLAAIQAQPKSPKASGLTAADYVDIQQLVNRYGYVLDLCENKGYGYADLYTADGVFIDTWSDLGFARGGVRWEGRERLAEAAGGGPEGCPGTRRRSVTHLAVNHVITPTADGATGRVYLISGGGNGDRDILQRSDIYEDIYAKTPKGWRFKQRNHVRDRDTGRFNPGVAPRER